jgi:hypothetical protein
MENSIYLNDSRVSRVHFSIYFKDGTWYIVDGDGVNKSASGTWHYVQEPFMIKDKLQVKICESTLTFEFDKK